MRVLLLLFVIIAVCNGHIYSDVPNKYCQECLTTLSDPKRVT